jgi:hypothetical protein
MVERRFFCSRFQVLLILALNVGDFDIRSVAVLFSHKQAEGKLLKVRQKLGDRSMDGRRREISCKDVI